MYYVPNTGEIWIGHFTEITRYGIYMQLCISLKYSGAHGHLTGGHLAAGHGGAHPTHAHPPVGEGEGLAQSAVPLLVVSIEVQPEAQALQALVMAAG